MVGILRRSAEGHIKHWFAVLAAMLTGGLWVPVYGSQVGTGQLYGKRVFLPDMFGWAGALIFSIAILIAFYIFITRLEAGKKKISSRERS